MPQLIKVLLIEDNRIEARQTQHWLSTAKRDAFEVECVEKLAQGFDRLSKGGLDIVLLDLNLPDSRGIETFVKLYHAFPEIPIVVLTGEYDETIGPMAVQKGAQDYVVKQRANGPALIYVLLYALVRNRTHREQLANERSRRQAEVAKAVQLRMLPRRRPIVSGYRFWDYYKAAEHVGGDYFGYFALPDQRIAVSIADVCGKGISAALTVAELCSEVRHCLETSPCVDLAMSRLNQHFCEYDSFITFTLCILDPIQHTLTVANAGHAPPLRKSTVSGDVEPLKLSRTALPLGLRPNEMYFAEVFDIRPGDLFVLYTDGVTDVRGPSKEFFGADKLMQSLRRTPPIAELAIPYLVREVEKFRGPQTQCDDMCLVGFVRCDEIAMGDEPAIDNMWYAKPSVEAALTTAAGRERGLRHSEYSLRQQLR